jgi:serine/threonine protein kinase
MSSRGTPAYRAPELLRENATFTNKLDIWNLGCVLFELIHHHPLFTSDWAVQQYDRSSENLRNFVSLAFKLDYQTPVGDLISELLDRYAKSRPSGKDCCIRLGDLVIAVAYKGLFPSLRGESSDERSLFAYPDVQYSQVWAWFPEYVRIHEDSKPYRASLLGWRKEVGRLLWAYYQSRLNL